MTNIERWKDLLDEPPAWGGRNECIARYIRPGSTVLDLGAGTQDLAHFLPPGCEYQPCDIVDGPGVLFCDFNAGNWPAIEQKYDYVVCSGVLEYMTDMVGFLRTVPVYLGHVMLASYHPLRHESEWPGRVKSGWLNHFTALALEELFTIAGLEWQVIDIWQDQVIYRVRHE